MKEIIRSAAKAALAIAFLLVVGHWLIGGLSASLSQETLLTDVTSSLLVNVAVWPLLVFFVIAISEGTSHIRHRRRMEHLA